MVRSLYKTILFVIAVVLSLLLILGYFSYWVPIHLSSLLPFFGLIFPFVYLSNLVLIPFLFLSFRKFFIVHVLVVLLGLPFITNYVQFDGAPEGSAEEVRGNTFKLMTWNVNLMGYNEVNRQVKLESDVIRDSMIAEIAKKSPDVLAFQEFLQTPKQNHITLIKEKLEMPYHHVRFSHAKSGRRKSGVVMFSKFPIVNSGYVPFTGKTNNFCIFIDVKQGLDTLRIYNVHFQSIRFQMKDYDVIDSQGEEKKGWYRIMDKMQRAYVQREGQVHIVKQHAKTSPYPCWIVGDFNDPPQSYTYHAMKAGMMDSFKEAGSGVSSTYVGRFPNFRIDYILSPELGWKTLQYDVPSVNWVDHRPVYAEFDRLK
jgi:endonuclease/exonuclease/phosphatase family metal-dependent hydrolase